MRRVIARMKPYAAEYPRACPKLKEVLDNISQCIMMDPFAMIAQMTGNSYKAYKFFSRHPQHCGLWIHCVRNLFHSHAIEYAAVPGGVMYTTQLYHALRQEGLLGEQRWEDLETLWKMQGDSTYFFGEPPTTFEGYWKNYCLAMGFSATSFAANRRGKGVKTNKGNLREMKFKGITSRLILPRIATDGDHRLLTPDTVEEWISQGAEGRSHHSSSPSTTDLPPSSSKDKKHFTPLLHRLAAAIASEIPDVTFDYFTMHDNCWAVLLLIKAEIDKMQGPTWSQQYKVDGQNLPFVVGVAFSAAAGKLDVERDISPSMDLLQGEAKVLQRWLEEGNGSVIAEAAGREVQMEELGGMGDLAEGREEGCAPQ